MSLNTLNLRLNNLHKNMVRYDLLEAFFNYYAKHFTIPYYTILFINMNSKSIPKSSPGGGGPC